MDDYRKELNDVYHKLIKIKKDYFGSITAPEINMLVEDNQSSLVQSCKHAASTFKSKKICQLVNCQVNKSIVQGEAELAYYIRIGYIHNFRNTELEVPKSMWLYQDERITLFEDVLVNFYVSLFKEVSFEEVKTTLLHKSCLHVVLFHRKKTVTQGSRKISKTVDRIIASISFCVNKDMFLVNWMGVTDKFYFTNEFGANDEVCHKEPVTFQRNFHIGKFLLHATQMISMLMNGMLKPIFLQCNEDISIGPRLFYENCYLFHLVGDYGQPIIKKIEETFPATLYLPTNEETRLIWMAAVGSITLTSNFWMHDPLVQPFLQKNENNTVNIIACIAFSNFYSQRIFNLRYYETRMDIHQKIVDENNMSTRIAEYLQNYKELVGEHSISQDILKNVKKTINAEIINGKLYTEHSDDPQFNYLLDNFGNEMERLEVLDHGQGSLPNEGNCGFLTMSRMLNGTEKEYYPLRIFFSYLYKSLSKLPSTHPLIMADGPTDVNHPWYIMKDNLIEDCATRICDFAFDDSYFTKMESEKYRKYYKIPVNFKKKFAKSPIKRHRRILECLGSIIRDTRFWASQYEFYLFSTIFNKHIFLLQPTNTLKVNDKGEEEWYLNLLSDNFFQAKNLFLPPGRTEPPQTQCFMGLINLEHFVSLRLVPKKKSNKANQPDIPPVNDACNNGNVDPNPPNIPPVNDSTQTNSQFPGKSPNKINGVDTDSSDSDNQVIGNKKENKNAKRKRLLKERMYQKVIERIQQQKDKERLSEKNKTQAGRMLNKQPRGKRLRAPKNTDYYSDASGDIVDDNISIDQPDEILMENLVAKKTKHATIQKGLLGKLLFQ